MPKGVYKRERGASSNHWQGGRRRASNGYIMIWVEAHPNMMANGCVFEHVKVVSDVLGRGLRYPEQVHHVDEDVTNNARNNLVLCPDDAYHKLLHQRMKALKACGDPTARKCYFCKEWDDVENLLIRRGTACHQKCRKAYDKKRRRKKRRGV